MYIFYFDCEVNKVNVFDAITKVLSRCKVLINSEEFKEDSCMKETDFTRNRKLSFFDHITLILRCNKKSMQIAINSYIDNYKSELESYSKQAFSKGRMRIKPTAFLTILRYITRCFYEESQPKTFKGYRVSAIDGSKYNLPNSKELLEAFGSEDFSGRTIVQALGSCLFDVLNGIILDANLYPHNANERVLATEHLNNLDKIKTEKELILFDRGYPSRELIYDVISYGFSFLMRVNKDNFLAEIKNVTSNDEIIEREYRDTMLKMRVVTIQIGNTTETLITNLPDSFTIDDLKDLYHLRWGIETLYNNLKNKMEIENFSGISRHVVLQDFYATLALQNLVAVAEYDAQKALDEADKYKKLKYKRKINSSMAIGEWKRDFINIIITKSPIKQAFLLEKLQNRIMKYVVSIRPDRSFKRENKHKASKYPNNVKSVD